MKTDATPLSLAFTLVLTTLKNLRRRVHPIVIAVDSSWTFKPTVAPIDTAGEVTTKTVDIITFATSAQRISSTGATQTYTSSSLLPSASAICICILRRRITTTFDDDAYILHLYYLQALN